MDTKLHFNSKHTNEELMEIMRKYAETDFPTIRKFTAKNGLPTARVYIDRFGSFQEAILLSGIKIPQNREKYFNRVEYSDENLLESLQKELNKYIENNNRLMSAEDIRVNRSLPSLSVYLRRFDNLDNVYRKLGYSYNDFNTERIKEEMAYRYVELSKLLGFTPTSRDIDLYSTKVFCKSASTYIHHFGSIRKLQEYCMLSPTKYGRGRNEEALINDLICLKEKIGRVPTQHDLDERNDIANAATYRIKFGSLPNALELAGLESNRKIVHVTNKGTVCFSRLEVLFAQLLESRGLLFLKDEPYSNWITDYQQKHTFDFVVSYKGNPFFVEIFGIIGDKKYEETKILKRKVCRENNIKLIEFTKDNFWAKKQAEVYDHLLNQFE